VDQAAEAVTALDAVGWLHDTEPPGGSIGLLEAECLFG
jgi:hypothetical protein